MRSTFDFTLKSEAHLPDLSGLWLNILYSNFNCLSCVQSIPELAFPGGCLIGCAAGFANVPKVKGTHNAIRSGRIAGEAIFEHLRGESNKEKRIERCYLCFYNMSSFFAESYYLVIYYIQYFHIQFGKSPNSHLFK